VLEKVTLKVTAPTLEEARKRPLTGWLGPSAATLDGFELRLRNAAGSSNPFLLALAKAPVVLDNEANDTAATAQAVSLPCEIAGRVEKRRDRDWYVFEAKRGETWNIEVFSNRLGAPTYMAFLLRNAVSKANLYESPLFENMNLYARQFFARSEDPPAYRFTAPADGKYLLLVFDRAADTLAGPRGTYHVRITRDEPDFHLVALSGENKLPDCATVGAGGHQALSVFAWRHTGFTGDIELTVEGLPAGVTCTPQPLAANVRQATVVLRAAPGAAPWSGEIKVKGTATVNGVKVVREARSGCIVWPVQQGTNAPTVSRLDRALMLGVRGKAPFALSTALDKVEVRQGERAVLKVKQERFWPDLKGPLQVQIMQSPQQQGSELPIELRVNNFAPINLSPAQKEGSLPVTVGPNTPPGVYNIVLRGQTQVLYSKDPGGAGKQNIFVVQPAAPVTLTVVPRALANLNLSTNNVTVKIGTQAEVVVRVARLFSYAGEFKVQLVLPPGVTGVEAADVVIPAGMDTAKLVVRVPAAAAPGFRGNLLVRATALWNGKVAIPHEARFNVNVVK
jgi:hypothetical protein